MIFRFKQYSLKKKIILFWSVLLGSAFLVITILLLTAGGFFGELPSIADLQNPNATISSEVYSEDGVLIGKFYQRDRIYVKYEDISPFLVQALISTEDERFYQHSGIDLKALMRAIGGVITFVHKGGGSTITQQLALNLLYENDKSHQRANNVFKRAMQKLKEWVVAIKLERNFTKEEIITLYLNTIPFGENLYGVKNAAKTYFQKAPFELSLEEAAVLIGMLKGNTIYNPKRNPKAALERRNIVIEQMYKNNFISYAKLVSSKSQPLVIKYLKLDEQSGIATHFREIVREDVKNILKEIKKPDGSYYDMYKDGLRVYTTIDSRMQAYAEDAVNNHLPIMQKILNQQSSIKSGSVWNDKKDVLIHLVKQSDRYKNFFNAGYSDDSIKAVFDKKINLKVFDWNEYKEKDTFMSPLDSIKYSQQFLQTGFMAMDVKNGHVKAWVGGINYKYFKYDHVNINTKRQVGSSIKPLLYALSIMDLNYNYNTLFPNTPQCFPEYDNWCSHNTDYETSDYVPMWKALALSLNNVSAYLIRNVTPKRFVEFLQSANITSHLLPVPSLALGTPEISLFEMVNAYSMFPARGYTVKPIYISRIEDRNGNVIKSFTTERKYVINSTDAFTMTQLMKNVVDFGTAASMRYTYKVKGEIAGKTGTTNDNSDAWFIGYSPNIVAASWVGCDQRFISISSNMGFGGKSAMPIFANFIKSVYDNQHLFSDTAKRFVSPVNYETKIKDNNVDNKQIKKNNDNQNNVDYQDLYINK